MDNSIKPTAKCKCGNPAEFIKDYFVTESKKVKEKTYDETFVSNEEHVCGIIRRRFCGRCLSKCPVSMNIVKVMKALEVK